MENRFGFKDLLLLSVLVVLIVVVLLAMRQFDRQWDDVKALKESAATHTSELADIQRKLARLRLTAATSGPVVNDDEDGNVPAAFARIAAAKKLDGYTMGDWFVDSIGNTDKLTPLTSTDVYAADVQSKVLESLATRDPVTLKWIPLLAESFEQNPKDLTISFKIRRGIVFSDGKPMTADDVVFTFDWIMNPKIDAPRERAYYDKVESVKKVNDFEVVFKFKEPYFKWMELAGGMSILPKHFYSRFKPEEFNDKPGLLMGTGQYRLEDPANWSPGKPIQLLRNERYWGLAAGFDRIMYRNLDSSLAKIAAFKNGEIDGLFMLQTDEYQALLKDKEVADRSQHFDYTTPTAGYRYVAWNQKRDGKTTRFADKRVRQAMTLLSNRERMVTDLLDGLGQEITGPFPPSSDQHDPNLKPWPYDVDRAKQLLADAGFADRNGDKVIEGPDGTPFAFKLTYPSKIPSYQRMAGLLKDSYAKAGIQMELEPLDWSVFSQRLKTRDFDAISLGWGTSIEGDIFQMFHSSQIEGGADNTTSYVSPELDKIIEAARRTMEDDKRMALWHKAEAILHEDQPYTFLFTRNELAVVDKRIKNIQKLPLGLNGSEEWFVPASQWKWAK